MTDTLPLNDGSIKFVEHWLPPLMAGEYTITISQHLKNTDPDTATTKKKNQAFDETYVNVKTFAVRGERFSLNPDELVSRFPPANNQGEYANVLPHVTLKRRTLPWERSPELAADDDSWLALLLFEKDEAPPVQALQVGDLQREAFWDSADAAGRQAQRKLSSLPPTTASYPDAYALLPPVKDTGTPPPFALSVGENWWDPCQIIDVPADLFSAIVPTREELGWLAHVRIVALTSKTNQDASEAEGLYSVVVGNRLPAPNTQCSVHLVSLEGLAPFLPTGDGETASPLKLAAGGTADKIRLVSLANWSFTSIDPAETFTGYLEAVLCAPLKRDALASANGSATATVNAAFAMGYTAMNHHGRLGDDTVSWYRGPLLPYVATAAIVPPPSASAIAVSDEAVRFDPATGMMDVSYAAAWQIGRSIGLQNSLFATSLYTWKRAAARNLVRAAETGTVANNLRAMTPHMPMLAAAAPVAMVGHRQLQTLAINVIADKLAAQLPPEPAAETH